MKEHPHNSDQDEKLAAPGRPDTFHLARLLEACLDSLAESPEMTDCRLSATAPAPDAAPVAAINSEAESQTQTELIGLLINLLREAGTGLWRLRLRMMEPASEQTREEMRRARWQLENLWETLAQAGLRIQDHTGEQIPEYGAYALKVLAYEPAPEATRSFVVETVKPTIYLKDQMIQMGEVIVGSPSSSS